MQCRDLKFISAVLIRYHWWMSCHKCYVYQSELKIFLLQIIDKQTFPDRSRAFLYLEF